MRFAIQYARHGAAKYISHLDMQRAFSRAVRRAQIDAQYSQGFNPHIIMSFASPLSVGYTTNADYLELGVEDTAQPRAAMDALNAALPVDIRVLDVFALPMEFKKKLMSLNHSAMYSIAFSLENQADYARMESAVQNINELSNYLTKNRKGKEIDIRPYILKLDCAGHEIRTVLQNSATGALNPAVLANAALEKAGLHAGYEICRTECYAELNGKVLPFSALKDIVF